MQYKKYSVLTLLFMTLLPAQDISHISLAEQMSALNYEIKHEATELADSIPALSQQEMIVLINFLYFAYMGSYYEGASRTALDMILQQSLAMQQELDAQKQLQTAVKTHFILQKFTNELLPQKIYALTSWDACLEYIEQSNSDNLQLIIHNLQDYGQYLVSRFVQNNTNYCNILFKNNFEIVVKHMQTLNFFKGIMQSIIEGENPFMENADTISDLETAFSSTDILLKHTQDVVSHLLKTKEISIEMLVVTSILLNQLYNAFYLKYQDLYDSQIPVIFDENGLLDTHESYQYLPGLADLKLNSVSY